RKDDALAAGKAAVSADPKSAPAHYLLGNIYAARQDRTEAINEYTEVLNIAPGFVPAQLDLSRLQMSAGQPGTAVELASAAIRANPKNPDARLALVQGLRVKGDLAGAAAELKPLLQALPNVAPVHVEAGEIALRQKDYASAAASFDKAMK